MSWTHRPAFDGMRTLAVYLVLAFHGGIVWLAGGFVGVDFFFVLSGFLVTSILAEELVTSGRVDLGRFYARRVRRLLPAAVVVVLAVSAVFVLIASTVRRDPWTGDAQSALLYVANWRFLSQSNEYFAAGDVDKSPFLHFWSLSIEEQYYFVFPLLLVGLFKLRHHARRAVSFGIAGLLVASLLSQLYWATVDTDHAYYGTDARLYQLLAGSLAAIALREIEARRPSSERPASRRSWGVAPAFAGVGGLAGLILVATSAVDLTPSWRGILATACSVALILGVAVRDDQLVGRLFARPLPAYLGRISYGTYLWHWPVILGLVAVLKTGPVPITVLAAGIATALAALSYEVLEMPIRRARSLAPIRFPMLAIGVATSAVLALTVVPQLLQAERRPVVATESAQAAPGAGRVVPAGINWKKYARERGTPETACHGSETAGCTLVEGDGPAVLLVGDSHGSMLAPSLARIAEERDWTLLVDVQGACPWQLGLYNAADSAEEQASCRRSREEAYGELVEAADVDLVVLTNRARDDSDMWGDVIVSSDEDAPRGETLNQRVLRTTDHTLTRLEATGARTVIVENIITTPEDFNPLDCVSGAARTDRCLVAVPPAPLSDSFYRTAAARSNLVWTININSVACPEPPPCQPLRGRIPVWRDSKHYTPQLLVEHADEVESVLEESGALHGLG